jgi:hypothetical protein
MPASPKQCLSAFKDFLFILKQFLFSALALPLELSPFNLQFIAKISIINYLYIHYFVHQLLHLSSFLELFYSQYHFNLILSFGN